LSTPKADIGADIIEPRLRARTGCEQSQQGSRLFDQLVRSSYEGERHCETERFRSLEVDNQLHRRGLLDRQIGRPLALQDSTHIATGKPIGVCDAATIADQATCLYELVILIHGR